MLPSAPATVPLTRSRKPNFPVKKRPAYLTLLIEAYEHPDAPADDRRELRVRAQKAAARLTPIDVSPVETLALESGCDGVGL